MPITIKQAKFISAYLTHGNGGRAYRAAYDAQNMSDGAIRVEACRLLQRPNVAQRIEEARKRMAAKAEVTLQKVIDMLLADREFAYDRKNPSAAIAATMGLARVTGHMVEDRRNVKAPLADFGTDQLLALEQLLADMDDETRIH